MYYVASVDSKPVQTGAFGLPQDGGAGEAINGDRNGTSLPPPVRNEASYNPAHSLIRLPLSPTMSGPTQYVSKNEVAASYRPKSHVSPPPNPIPDLQSQLSVPLSFCVISFDRLTSTP